VTHRALFNREFPKLVYCKRDHFKTQQKNKTTLQTNSSVTELEINKTAATYGSRCELDDWLLI
jgi:hypothetical protein